MCSWSWGQCHSILPRWWSQLMVCCYSLLRNTLICVPRLLKLWRYCNLTASADMTYSSTLEILHSGLHSWRRSFDYYTLKYVEPFNELMKPGGGEPLAALAVNATLACWNATIWLNCPLKSVFAGSRIHHTILCSSNVLIGNKIFHIRLIKSTIIYFRAQAALYTFKWGFNLHICQLFKHSFPHGNLELCWLWL